jgi:hypothetical protein
MKTAIPQAVGWYAVWYPRPDGLLLRDVAFCFPVEKGSAMTLSREPDQVVRAAPRGAVFAGPFATPQEARTRSDSPAGGAEPTG